jgi:hypothetical protein
MVDNDILKKSKWEEHGSKIDLRTWNSLMNLKP